MITYNTPQILKERVKLFITTLHRNNYENTIKFELPVIYLFYRYLRIIKVMYH